MTKASSWQNSISLCPASFCTPKRNLPVTSGGSRLPTFAFQSPMMKRTFFFLGGGVSSRRSCRSSQNCSTSASSTLVDYCEIKWFAVERNRDYSVIFEIAPKYYISDSFVSYEGYSTYSREFLPTIVDIMVIWIKFTHSSPFYFTDSLNVNIHSCHLLFDHFQFTLSPGPSIPGFYTMFFFTASDFMSITSHIQNWALFLLWLHLFILSGVISPFFSSSTLGTYRPGELVHLSVSYLFACSYCLWVSQGKNTEVVCHSLLQWITFCQNSPPWPIHLGWHYMTWLIVSLN